MSIRIIFVAGMSGSGRSTAMAALEDLSFYCVDNLPPQLVAQFLTLCNQATPAIEKIALAVDAREERFLGSLPDVVAELRAGGTSVEMIFLDCADEVLEKRYRETRRVHPLSPTSVADGIARERALLSKVSALADFRVETSSLNVHHLRETITQYASGLRVPWSCSSTSVFSRTRTGKTACERARVRIRRWLRSCWKASADANSSRGCATS
jgi:UPF0042 nucleotide-binding protein